MQITIEDNAFMYIYLKSKDNHKKIGKCLADVKCLMLYDANDNLIGLKLLNARDNTDISLNGILVTETIQLPTVGYVNTPIYNATIAENENDIVIMFDGDCEAVIHRVREDVCNIDLCKEGIFGIEIIASSDIGNKDVMKPFIIQDIPLTLNKVEY